MTFQVFRIINCCGCQSGNGVRRKLRCGVRSNATNDILEPEQPEAKSSAGGSALEPGQ
jgi:hypothetical protein